METLREVVKDFKIENIEYSKIKKKLVIKKNICEKSLKKIKPSPHVSISMYKKWFSTYGAL